MGIPNFYLAISEVTGITNAFACNELLQKIFAIPQLCLQAREGLLAVIFYVRYFFGGRTAARFYDGTTTEF
jgi:hypothetical protein